MLFGAPWFDNKKIVENLNNQKMEGVTFSEEDFIPKESKYRQVQCKGVRVHLQNKKEDPFFIGLRIIDEIYKTHPSKFQFNDVFFDKLYGSDVFRKGVLDNGGLGNIGIFIALSSIALDVEGFILKREGSLLY